VYRLRNPDRPFKTLKNKRGALVQKLDFSEKIEIFDCFGFFQMSLVAAIRDTPGAVTDAELDTIKSGKKERGNFRVEDWQELKPIQHWS
jgi:hypothetical protein